jgi:hypothetical protein
MWPSSKASGVVLQGAEDSGVDLSDLVLYMYASMPMGTPRTAE